MPSNDAIVTRTLLYGSGCWTMTADRERLLGSTQRRMLRWMLGSFWRRPAEDRQAETDSSSNSNSTSGSDFPEPEGVEDENDENTSEEETWVDWIKRTTHIAEAHLRRTSVDDWVEAQRRRQWRLAGHTARRTDSRWSVTVLGWQPPYSNRGRGHPVKRWTTELDAYFFHLEGVPSGIWIAIALDRDRWHLLEDGFVRKAWSR